MRGARYLWPLVVVWALLGASECTESSINQDINDVFGINTDSPAQVGGAILLGKALGNAEERQAADMGSTLKDFRRADHEQKGDQFSRAHIYPAAEREYTEALEWTGSGQQQDRKRADLETRLASTYWSEGDPYLDAPVGVEVPPRSTSDAAKSRQAAQHYAAAAALRERDPEYRNRQADIGNLYLDQAYSSHVAGDEGAACQALRKASTKGTKDDGLRTAIEAHGLTCKV